jgi:hypothetical protein
MEMNFCRLMAENDSSCFPEDNSWRKTTVHGPRRTVHGAGRQVMKKTIRRYHLYGMTMAGGEPY